MGVLTANINTVDASKSSGFAYREIRDRRHLSPVSVAGSERAGNGVSTREQPAWAPPEGQFGAPPGGQFGAPPRGP